MKKEKNILQEKFSAGEYLAPRVMVKKIRARRVICSSITKMTVSDNEQGDEDFSDN